jgi:hypothetical protein
MIAPSARRMLTVLIAAVGIPACRESEHAPPQARPSTSGARLGAPTASPLAQPSTSRSMSPKLNVETRRCDQLPPSQNDVPLGPDGLDVRTYASDAAPQQPRLLRVLAIHPDSPGGDPDFSISNSTLFDAIPSYLVFSRKLPLASRYRLNPSQGATLYSVVGRFSGREIDHYEWYRVQYRKEDDPSTIEGELRKARLETWPEFCVESWCFVPDPFPEREWPEEQKSEVRTAYAKQVQRMLREGAKLCKGVVHFKRIAAARKADSE